MKELEAIERYKKVTCVPIAQLGKTGGSKSRLQLPGSGSVVTCRSCYSRNHHRYTTPPVTCRSCYRRKHQRYTTPPVTCRSCYSRIERSAAMFDQLLETRCHV